MIDKDFQNQKYGTEAINAVMKNLVFELLKYNVGGAPFKEIEATAREDNPASWIILEKVDFKLVGYDKAKFKVPRKVYKYVDPTL